MNTKQILFGVLKLALMGAAFLVGTKLDELDRDEMKKEIKEELKNEK